MWIAKIAADHAVAYVQSSRVGSLLEMELRAVVASATGSVIVCSTFETSLRYLHHVH